MLILLPPSETKRDGGEGAPLEQLLAESALSFPQLNAIRKRVVAATVSLARKPKVCAEVLKLSPKQMGEVDRNKAVKTSPTMPAIDRYTGVLYDGLAAMNLDEPSRNFLRDNVMIQSALLGPVGALEPIPAYRLSFDSKLPALAAGSLKKAWAEAGSKALAKKLKAEPRLVLDLRSEGYSALAPLAPAENTVYLRVVTKGENGQLRALNHFNKKGKGEFVRALAKDSANTSNISSAEELIAWGKTKNLILEPGAEATADWPAELNLVVSGVVQKLC
ncbi:YaaA family protein [uncultured Aurantimicrobium sp.]|uniref:YaaA family protein n=1 Tax=uncultured Aurantimicrobium sp. TaxID=1705357 RepID=UPI00262F7AB5|nr:peroxide stress protein YaaA [uncultured Aurantimicrobium sp.]